MRGFKFDEFDALCADLDADQLQLKWQHYTRALSAASSSTAVATLAAAPTGGISMIGAIIAGPLMHNARKKRQIIERHMSALDVTPETRKKDIVGPALLSGFLGGATAGIGMGAEALAVDKATKIIGHVVADGIMTKVEDARAAKEHAKEIQEHEEGQLIRTSSTPAVVSALAVPKRKDFADAVLKHTRSMPDTLGATANGLMASAIRIKAHNYPLLKEYVSSITTQSKDLIARGQNKFKPDSSNDFVHDSTPAQPANATLVLPHASMSSHNPQVEHGSPQPSLVSPLESNASFTESELDPGLVSPCETVYSAELEGDYAFNNLLTTVDEKTLEEIELELERAIEEMDSLEVSTDIPTENNKRMTRTFEAANDIDQIFRRQSTRYNRRISVRYTQLPASRSWDSLDNSEADFYTSRVSSREQALHRLDPEPEEIFEEDEDMSSAGTVLPMYVETDPSTAPEAHVFSDEKECKRPNEEWMDEKQVVEDPYNPFAQSFAQASSSQQQDRGWYDEKQAVMDPAMKVRHPSLHQDDFLNHSNTWPSSTPPPAYYGYYSDEKEVMVSDTASTMTARPHLRGGAPSTSASYFDGSDAGSYSYASSSHASSSRYIISHPSNSQLVTRPATALGNETPQYSESLLAGSGPWGPPTDRAPSIAPSTTSTIMSRSAMKGHQGMKKVGYLGLEPAAKLAIGGSLLLMGVRPSVQRKMLDKAKSKMGMDREYRDEDDDYRDYI